MEYHHRLIEERLRQLLEYFPVVAVLGARQVGKSTLAEHCLGKNARVVEFDPVIDIRDARKDPDFFLQNLETPAFLDEVQYAPELLNAIKRRVDKEKRPGQYLISGSQNLSVLKDISESLAGRVAVLNLWPMAQSEILQSSPKPWLHRWIYDEDLKAPETSNDAAIFPLLWRGGHPKLLDFPEALIPEYWSSYLRTYIERDIRKVANVGSLQTFGSFVSLLAALSAQEENPSQLGRELGVDRKTAQAWLEIAKATFQWFSVPAFSKNPIKRISGKSKGFFADTGLLCHLQKISSPEALQGHPLKGRIFETYVTLELCKQFQAWSMAPNLYHFRSYSGAEVDLILEMNGTLFPIEIKMKSNPGIRDIQGIETFRTYFPQERISQGIVICAIPQPRWVTKEVLAIPWWAI